MRLKKKKKKKNGFSGLCKRGREKVSSSSPGFEGQGQKGLDCIDTHMGTPLK